MEKRPPRQRRHPGDAAVHTPGSEGPAAGEGPEAERAQKCTDRVPGCTAPTQVGDARGTSPEPEAQPGKGIGGQEARGHQGGLRGTGRGPRFSFTSWEKSREISAQAPGVQSGTTLPSRRAEDCACAQAPGSTGLLMDTVTCAGQRLSALADPRASTSLAGPRPVRLPPATTPGHSVPVSPA